MQHENNKTFMEPLQDYLLETATAAGFLKGPMGMTDEDIAALRNRYLEKVRE